MFATDAVHNSPTPQHHQEHGQIAEEGEGTGMPARVADAAFIQFAN
jgi:tRNA U34 5-methylaminomethyl-2-thiouridine-forming methyltransferase MnmC